MRAAALLAILLAGCAAPPQGKGGIVSLNPCADAMLVALVPNRISAISRYSHDPATSSISPEVARRYKSTTGTAEEVLALNPSLVIASSFTQPATRGALARAGLRVIYFDSPTTIAASRAQLLALARAVGAQEAGEAVANRIDSAVADARAAAGAPVPALLWIGGNMVSGGGNLLNDMMVRAGFRNAAADYGLRFTGHLPMEQVVARPPRVMLVPDLVGGDADSRAARLRTRALAASGARVTHAAFARQLVNCGGPVIVDAMRRLAEVRRLVAS